MRAILLSALALGALTTAALADGMILTDEQMDKVQGGFHFVGVPGQAARGEQSASVNLEAGCAAGQGCQDYIHINPTGLGRYPDARFNSNSPPK